MGSKKNTRHLTISTISVDQFVVCYMQQLPDRAGSWSCKLLSLSVADSSATPTTTGTVSSMLFNDTWIVHDMTTEARSFPSTSSASTAYVSATLPITSSSNL